MVDVRTARATVRAMKAGRTPPIEVGSPVFAVERPVTTSRTRSPAGDARLITDWRNIHPSAFLTEFRAESERTEAWLNEVVEPDESRLLFMLEDPQGQAFGHLGLTGIDLERHRAELDAVVRGKPTVRGAMAACVTGLAEWARVHLGTTHLFLRVRSDNPAIAFYERIGFAEARRVPIRPVLEREEVHWVEDPGASGVLEVVYMDYVWPAAEGERSGRSQIAFE